MKLSLPLTALMLVVGLSACGKDTPEPTPTPSASPGKRSASGSPVILDIAKLDRGGKPRIAWSRGSLLDGDRAQAVLPPNLDEFAQTRQLLVVSDLDDNVYAYGPEGPANKTPIGTATGSFAMNDKRNLVAWIAPDGSPTVLQEGHAKPVVLPAPKGVDGGHAIAVIGNDCFNGPETVEGAGCSVYFQADGQESAPFVASNHGFVEEASDQISGLQDADSDGIVGWTKLNQDMSTCSRYAPSGSARKGWQTCEHVPLEFSPDGEHLLATGPHGIEGLGTSELSILDRTTGKATLTVNTLDGDAAFITRMTWEDATHVLAVVFQNGEWAVVRIRLDGAMDIAVAPTKGEETEPPFTLSVQP